MVSEQDLQEMSAAIAREFRPEQIVLFGSYAYGKPNEYSDVDLLIVMRYDGTPLGQAVKIVQKVRPPFMMDVIVRTQEEVKQRLLWNDRFLKDILTKGRVLYAAANG